jgi:hypothetical protein
MNLMIIRIASILLILAVAASAASKIKVACVGNSITAGNSMYPPYLQTLLGSGYQVENEGVGATTLLKKGDVPYWTQGRLKQALAFNPNIVTIKLGTNDTKSQNWVPTPRRTTYRPASIISFPDKCLTQFKIFDLAGRAVHFSKIGDKGKMPSARAYLLESERGMTGKIIVFN